ncbi:hypothetical protein GF359_09590 [candidate division WOR-3 bacterium]|uniref:UDP-3-O-acyl-N-acetylglucosamine deacetylase n=1 Tax=candidate division WOR-3 bacterium TaxID=2052148 RepID=A0A9D5KD83_UNCW3|nr:hypothetical protein [candidate division WOR-3 bacterium]MBD3365451.1 hypothetical protein [candidate division WOR-3 bacterium]
MPSPRFSRTWNRMKSSRASLPAPTARPCVHRQGFSKMNPQRTLRHTVSVEGPTLWSKGYTRVWMYPGEPDEGITIRRVDLKPAVSYPLSIHAAVVENHKVKLRPTTYSAGGEEEDTLDFAEHLLSALWGMGIDNVGVDVEGGELPFFDGSALAYVEAVRRAGVRLQEHPRNEAHINESFLLSTENSALFFRSANRLSVTYVFYNLHRAMLQTFSFTDVVKSYELWIAPARTFAVGAFPEFSYPFEVRSNRDLHYPYPSRFSREMLRHKVLDLIGDLALLGRRLNAKIIAVGTGHRETHQAVKLLTKEIARGELEHRLDTLQTPPPVPFSDGR